MHVRLFNSRLFRTILTLLTVFELAFNLKKPYVI